MKSITWEIIINWLIVLGIGGAVLGLVRALWNSKMKSLVTKNQCLETQKVVVGEIKKEVKEQFSDLKEFIQLKIDRDILISQKEIRKELKKLNNKD